MDGKQILVQILNYRSSQMEKAKDGQTWGIILGTLGRQGHPRILHLLEEKIKKSGRNVVRILLSEIFPQKLALMDDMVFILFRFDFIDQRFSFLRFIN